jgi:hypothetical protein
VALSECECLFGEHIILRSWRVRDFEESPRFQSVNEKKKEIDVGDQKKKKKKERFYLYKAGLYIPTLHLIERGCCCRSWRS